MLIHYPLFSHVHMLWLNFFNKVGLPNSSAGQPRVGRILLECKCTGQLGKGSQVKVQDHSFQE